MGRLSSTGMVMATGESVMVLPEFRNSEGN